MEKKNRYRNPVRVAAVFRLVFFCLLLGIVGGTFVFLRNLHVKRGDEIRKVEIEIAELDHEMQLWEIRIAGARDRIELSRRLKWLGSDLQPIDPSRILKIDATAAKE
ncbi:MAG: hypothetical protein P1V20_27495 [Verrucomicrobiales bacterium]|nr:hypothetical protein [Verrucomicrobiales bacterium]